MTKMIIKRDGSVEDFNSEKIYKAIKKAFISTNRTYKDEELSAMVDELVSKTNGDNLSVEEIQNLVEEALMEHKYYDVARHYILYREERTKLRQYRTAICQLVPSYGLYNLLKEIQKDFPESIYGLDKLLNRYKSNTLFKMTEEERFHSIIRCANELTTSGAPKWDNITARLFLVNFYKELKENLKTYNLGNFYDRLVLYTTKYHYDKDILIKYSKEEIAALEKIINKNRDKYLNFAMIQHLSKRYLVKLKELDYVMSIQEFYLVVAMSLAKDSENKVEEATRYYNELSKHELSIDSSVVHAVLKSIK